MGVNNFRTMEVEKPIKLGRNDPRSGLALSQEYVAGIDLLLDTVREPYRSYPIKSISKKP